MTQVLQGVDLAEWGWFDDGRRVGAAVVEIGVSIGGTLDEGTEVYGG